MAGANLPLVPGEEVEGKKPAVVVRRDQVIPIEAQCGEGMPLRVLHEGVLGEHAMMTPALSSAVPSNDSLTVARAPAVILAGPCSLQFQKRPSHGVQAKGEPKKVLPELVVIDDSSHFAAGAADATNGGQRAAQVGNDPALHRPRQLQN